MKSLAGRVTVITGGASGFGLELARLAGQRGMKVVLADIQEDALEAARAELAAAGVDVLARVTNVAKAEEVVALAAAAKERFGAVHLLFNNAGVAAGGLLWESSLADWQWVLGVNLWGVIHGIHAFVPGMLAEAEQDPSYEGHVVNTASMAGMLSAPTLGVYAASKHAVVALTETLYQDLRLVDARVSASVLCPFYVATGIVASHRNRTPETKDGQMPTRSQRAAAGMVGKAVSASKVTAVEVATRTIEAVLADQFYVFSHPTALAGVETRFLDIKNVRNPTDPLAERPEVAAGLRAAVLGKRQA